MSCIQSDKTDNSQERIVGHSVLHWSCPGSRVGADVEVETRQIQKIEGLEQLVEEAGEGMELLKIEEQEQELVLVLAWSLGEQLCLGPQMFHGKLSTRQTGSHHTVPRSVSPAPMYLKISDW